MNGYSELQYVEHFNHLFWQFIHSPIQVIYHSYLGLLNHNSKYYRNNPTYREI